MLLYINRFNPNIIEVMVRPVSDIIVKELVPAMRAYIAKKLVEAYGLSQKQAAQKLGTTQPAISQYKRGIRGSKASSFFIQNQQVVELLNNLAKTVATTDVSDYHITLELFKACEPLLAGLNQ